MASSGSEIVFEQVKQEYMAAIFDEIRADAMRRSGPSGLRSVDAFRAFEDYFGRVPGRRHSLLGFVQEYIFLLSAIFLTLVFGAFGLYHGDAEEVSSFLDIAKIFAGAVVGGAAGSSAVALSRRKAGPAAK